jgi:hypothetical protein
MSEAGGPESREFWTHHDNQWKWTMWSTDQEATDRGQVVRLMQIPRDFQTRSITESRVVSYRSRAQESQESLPASSSKAKASETVVSDGIQAEPTQTSSASSVNAPDRPDQPKPATGGVANHMRVSPYRCALCKRRFYRNGRTFWQWTPCGGSVWNPNTQKHYECRAWLCRYDDECPKAGTPCPCCQKVKRLQISDQSGPRATIPGSNLELQSVAVPGRDDGDSNASWYDEHGVFHSLHEV